ncbi:peritrophin-1-like isoform X2 [Procambarus clarkii]
MTLYVVSLCVLLAGAWCVADAGPLGTEEPRVPCDPEVSAQCPPQDGYDSVYLPMPTDCSKFCICSGGTAYEKECFPGLVWDDTRNVCNWPNLVDCGTRPIP